jgi:hypothetical protein
VLALGEGIDEEAEEFADVGIFVSRVDLPLARATAGLFELAATEVAETHCYCETTDGTAFTFKLGPTDRTPGPPSALRAHREAPSRTAGCLAAGGRFELLEHAYSPNR